MKLIIFTILNFVFASTALNIQCIFRFQEHKMTDLDIDNVIDIIITDRYTCIANQSRGSDDENIEEVSGEHLNDYSNFKVRALNFAIMEVPKIPLGLDQYFKNILTLSADICNLTEITKNQMKQFPKLTSLSVAGNLIENLESDLFENNHDLQLINFADNEIKHIGINFLRHLPSLTIGFFIGNKCISMNFEVKQIDKFRDEIKNHVHQ